MLVIGLTGGIGSGKSTVCDMFREHHVPVIEADQVARDCVQPGTAAMQAIIQHFGNTLLTGQGHLNRQALKTIIFQDVKQRQWLEKLLHPAIWTEIQTQLARSSAPYVILDIPLLLETDYYQHVDYILVVDSSETLQIQRTMARDKLSQQQVMDIITTQTSRAKRLSHANDVIDNNHDLQHLASQVTQLHQKYLALAQGHQ